jgi:hypothetical protein
MLLRIEYTISQYFFKSMAFKCSTYPSPPSTAKTTFIASHSTSSSNSRRNQDQLLQHRFLSTGVPFPISSPSPPASIARSGTSAGASRRRTRGIRKLETRVADHIRIGQYFIASILNIHDCRRADAFWGSSCSSYTVCEGHSCFSMHYNLWNIRKATSHYFSDSSSDQGTFKKANGI